MEANYLYDLHIGDHLEQPLRFKLLLIDKQEVVFLNVVPQEEEQDGKDGNDRQRYREEKTHERDGVDKGLEVSQLEAPFIFERQFSHPPDPSEESLVSKVEDV